MPFNQFERRRKCLQQVNTAFSGPARAKTQDFHTGISPNSYGGGSGRTSYL